MERTRKYGWLKRVKARVERLDAGVKLTGMDILTAIQLTDPAWMDECRAYHAGEYTGKLSYRRWVIKNVSASLTKCKGKGLLVQDARSTDLRSSFTKIGPAVMALVKEQVGQIMDQLEVERPVIADEAEKLDIVLSAPSHDHTVQPDLWELKQNLPDGSVLLTDEDGEVWHAKPVTVGVDA